MIHKFPSVSQVLKPWQSPWPTEQDMIRGAKRHSAFAAYLLGTWAPPIDPRDEGQFKSFCGWADSHIKKVWFVERKLVDEGHGYSGTIDFCGLTDFYGAGVVIDWKPPSSLIPVYKSQLMAYEKLAIKAGYDVSTSAFLRPDPDGGTAKMDWMTNGAIAFNAFLSALNCWRFFNQEGDGIHGRE